MIINIEEEIGFLCPETGNFLNLQNHMELWSPTLQTQDFQARRQLSRSFLTQVKYAVRFKPLTL